MFCRHFLDRDIAKIVYIILEKRIRTRYIRKFDPKCEIYLYMSCCQNPSQLRRTQLGGDEAKFRRFPVKCFGHTSICNLQFGSLSQCCWSKRQAFTGSTPWSNIHGLQSSSQWIACWRPHWDGLGCTWSTLKVIVLRFSTFFSRPFWKLRHRNKGLLRPSEKGKPMVNKPLFLGGGLRWGV